MLGMCVMRNVCVFQKTSNAETIKLIPVKGATHQQTRMNALQEKHVHQTASHARPQ